MNPLKIPLGIIPIILPPSLYSATTSPKNLPTAEFIPIFAQTSMLPQSLKSSQLQRKAVMGGWWDTCSAVTQNPYSSPWKVSPIVGLNDFYRSVYLMEKDRTRALKAFILSIGFLMPLRSLGARLKHLQQDLRLLQGFMAKTGKLIPMNEPVDRNFEITNLIILGCKSLILSLMLSNPPSSKSLLQKSFLQNYQYSTTFFSAYFFIYSYLQAGSSHASSCHFLLEVNCLWFLKHSLFKILIILEEIPKLISIDYFLQLARITPNLIYPFLNLYFQYLFFESILHTTPEYVHELDRFAVLAPHQLESDILRIQGDGCSFPESPILGLNLALHEELYNINEGLEREGGGGPEAQIIGQHLLQAEELRKCDHKVFIGDSNEMAIQNVSPNISILYSNRARCYRELRDFDKSYSDAEKAVELDDKNIKGYFLMAETLSQIAVNSKDKSKIEMAIEKLKKSLRLCPSQGKSEFQERFVQEIYRAKKKLWILTTEQSADRKKALRSYLIKIVQSDSSISEEEKDALNDNIASLIQKKFNYKDKVPRSLICTISKMIMDDPVCNQYGNSYSKKAYVGQLEKNGKLDPMTLKPIKTNIMYTNINLKKAIESFLEKNPWAYEEVII